MMEDCFLMLKHQLNKGFKEFENQFLSLCQRKTCLLHSSLVNPVEWIDVIEDSKGLSVNNTRNVDAPDMIHMAKQ